MENIKEGLDRIEEGLKKLAWNTLSIWSGGQKRSDRVGSIH
jgi:hypothetical protein